MIWRDEILVLDEKVLIRLRLGKNIGEAGKLLHLPYDFIGKIPPVLKAFLASSTDTLPFWDPFPPARI